MNYQRFPLRKTHPGAHRPFGVIGPNGLNFAKSFSDQNSRLNQVILYLATRPTAATKKEILRDVFGVTNPNPHTVRGLHGTFFRMAVHAGFLSHRGRGSSTRWTLGKRVTYTTFPFCHQ
jgi:hypothetical protein